MGIITKFATHYSTLSLLLCVSVCFSMSLHIPKVRTIEDVDRFVLIDDNENIFYQEFKKIFGNDEFFVIVFEHSNIFSTEVLGIIKNLTEDLEKLELIRKVESLSNVDINIGGDDYFETRKFLDTIPDAENKLKKIRDIAVTHPLYINNFISKDGTTTAIVVSAYDRPEDDYYRKKLIQSVEQLLAKYEKTGINFHLAGKTVTDVTMSRYIDEDFNILIPISYILIASIIIFIYRNILLTIIAMLSISACLMSTFGFIGMTAITQNSVVSIVFPLVMALSLCDIVHIFSAISDTKFEKINSELYLKKILDSIIWPCFLTTVTTAIGFLSLMTNRLEPIQNFALVAFVAMIFEFIFSFFLIPPLILKFNVIKKINKQNNNRILEFVLIFISRISQKNHTLVLLMAITITCVALIAGSKIIVETNVVEFFKTQSLFRRDLDFVEKKLGGIESLDISLKASEPEAFKNPSYLAILDQIQSYARNLQGVDMTLSFADYIKDMNQAFNRSEPEYHTIPESKELIAQYLLLYDSDDIRDFITPIYDHARIVIRISDHSSKNQKGIILDLKKYINSFKKYNIDIQITGRVLQDVNVINTLFKSQIWSLGTAFLTISGIMLLALKSVRLGLLSILPNIFPIFINFGIMGAFGIPLNTATALIGAIAFGIAVDDTIHFLIAYKNMETNKSRIDRIQQVIMKKGQAILTSSLILCVGFGVMVLSNFIPTVHFGLLSTTVMITALIGDIIILPSIMMHYHYFTK